MIGFKGYDKMLAERGPRFVVKGTIRGGELAVTYAATAAIADTIAEMYRKEGYQTIQITPPVKMQALVSEMRELGKARRAAIEAGREITDMARAGVHRLTENGISETQAAEIVGVDRMTVRKWLGK